MIVNSCFFFNGASSFSIMILIDCTFQWKYCQNRATRLNLIIDRMAEFQDKTWCVPQIESAKRRLRIRWLKNDSYSSFAWISMHSSAVHVIGNTLMTLLVVSRCDDNAVTSFVIDWSGVFDDKIRIRLDKFNKWTNRNTIQYWIWSYVKYGNILLEWKRVSMVHPEKSIKAKKLVVYNVCIMAVNHTLFFIRRKKRRKQINWTPIKDVLQLLFYDRVNKHLSKK